MWPGWRVGANAFHRGGWRKIPFGRLKHTATGSRTAQAGLRVFNLPKTTWGFNQMSPNHFGTKPERACVRRGRDRPDNADRLDPKKQKTSPLLAGAAAPFLRDLTQFLTPTCSGRCGRDGEEQKEEPQAPKFHGGETPRAALPSRRCHLLPQPAFRNRFLLIAARRGPNAQQTLGRIRQEKRSDGRENPAPSAERTGVCFDPDLCGGENEPAAPGLTDGIGTYPAHLFK